MSSNFNPIENKTIDATTTSQQVQFTAAKGIEGGIYNDTDLYILNESGSVAFVAWGLESATATSSSFAVGSGVSVIDIADADFVAVMLASGAGKVYLSKGKGI
jgi:hypothetical protein